ncbi:hypothetical protein ACFFX0_21925 [Citricoccus parietis]|uniref:Uncharacterized protein n=1 Tax=Citricoccus parietis TaxID=592307 RepID=A0ABV5G444_9MICC
MEVEPKRTATPMPAAGSHAPAVWSMDSHSPVPNLVITSPRGLESIVTSIPASCHWVCSAVVTWRAVTMSVVPSSTLSPPISSTSSRACSGS